MLVSLLLLLAGPGVAPEHASTPFRFEAEQGYNDMKALVSRQFVGGENRNDVRKVFVDQGGATLIAHPRKPEVEKYIYDINLCSYYVWRWNISADYSTNGQLQQIYINGTPRLGGAPEPALPKNGPFFEITRPRPEAFKGEKNLKVIVAGGDGNPANADQMQILTGVVPMRADPLNMGQAVNERGEVWRSSFDFDQAKFIAPYAGDCTAVDTKYARRQPR